MVVGNETESNYRVQKRHGIPWPSISSRAADRIGGHPARQGGQWHPHPDRGPEDRRSHRAVEQGVREPLTSRSQAAPCSRSLNGS